VKAEKSTSRRCPVTSSFNQHCPARSGVVLRLN
jgi:hypothetical protein